MTGAKARELVAAYYDSWKDGIASFDEERVRSILAPDLKFEGPIAGKRAGREPFIKGLADFVRSVRTYQEIQRTQGGDESSALYECNLGVSGEPLRFAEFFRVQDGLIQEIRLVYDPSEFRRLTWVDLVERARQVETNRLR